MSERDDRMDPERSGQLWKSQECGRVALSWALAGGVLAGGFFLLSVALSATASSSSVPGATTVLFFLGGLAGLVHGGILGYLARDPARTRQHALGSVALAGGGLLVLGPLAWFVALHLALTVPFWSRGFFARGGVSLSWLLGIGLCLWAALEGWSALRRAFARWPERRLGSVLLTVILAVLMVRFFSERPAIWGTDIQVKGMGALILALGATVWIAFPVVLALLHGGHKLLGDRFPAAEGASTTGPAPPPA